MKYPVGQVAARSALERLGFVPGPPQSYDVRQELLEQLFQEGYTAGRMDRGEEHLRLLYFALIRLGWKTELALEQAKHALVYFRENSGYEPLGIPRVIVETPFAGDRERNHLYMLAALRDCVERGESPYASHAILPLVLDDDTPEERNQGIELGFAWRVLAHATVVYQDLGISGGMARGIEHAKHVGCPVVYRNLESWR